MSFIICKNCDHHFKGNFCPHCGQSAKVEPIGVKYFLHDIPHSIFHVDKGFWYTFKWLFRNPGKALSEYLEGKRIRHFRPIGFVLIMSAICSLLINGINTLMNIKLEAIHASERFITPHNLFGKYPSLLVFTLIPILAFITWLSFRKARYNYWEHFLINTYLAAQINILLLCIKVYGLLKISIGWNYKVNFSFAMSAFMFYYSFTFVTLMRPYYKRLTITWHLLIMNSLLAFVYMTGFSVSGLMQPWWGK